MDSLRVRRPRDLDARPAVGGAFLRPSHRSPFPSAPAVGDSRRGTGSLAPRRGGSTHAIAGRLARPAGAACGDSRARAPGRRHVVAARPRRAAAQYRAHPNHHRPDDGRRGCLAVLDSPRAVGIRRAAPNGRHDRVDRIRRLSRRNSPARDLSKAYVLDLGCSGRAALRPVRQPQSHGDLAHHGDSFDSWLPRGAGALESR